MRWLVFLVCATVLAGCAPPKPVDVVKGEACWRCRRPIEQVRLAGEVVAANGLASKFRTVHCMSTWIGQQKTPVNGTFFVTSYETGAWIRAEQASYVRVVVNRNTMDRDFLAFDDSRAAASVAQEENTPVATWAEVLELGRTEPIGG